MRYLIPFLAASALFGASPATACRIAPSNPPAMIHAALPTPLPAGVLIAEVELRPEDVASYYPEGRVRARIVRLIQGDYRGSALIFRPRNGLVTDCDRPGANGTSGLIVAIPTGYEEGVLVAEAIMAPRSEGFRLPDGFQLPHP
jgi:hypothetical protein